jgi:hypothetical protein
VDAEFKQTLYATQLSAQVAQKLEGALITGISKNVYNVLDIKYTLQETRNA